METTQFRAAFAGVAISLGVALLGCSSTVKRPDGGQGLLPVGSSAPDFAATTKAGDPTRLSALHGAPVVVYFYPKDETPGCTAQACAFRDQYQDFVDAGAEVIGVSGDGAGSHASFKEHHRLPFTLLSDPGGAGAKAFGVKKTLGLLAGRVTFVIDRGGVVRLRFDSQLQARRHIAEALTVVKSLS